MPTASRVTLLAASLVLLAACGEDPLTAPPTRLAPGAALVANEVGFRFLPPTMHAKTLPTGAFDAARRPTVRVVCTANAGPGCPVVATFGGDAVRLDVAGEHFSVMWHTPGDLALGNATYRLQVLDGASVVGSADLWVVDRPQDRRVVGPEHVAVARGAPLLVKFRIERQLLAGEPTAPASTVIPDEPYVPQAEDYAADNPILPGIVMSFNTLALALRPQATVADANALLASLGATVTAGLPGSRDVPGIMWIRVPSRTHGELDAVLATLREHPLVELVSRDVALGTTAVTATGPSVAPGWSWGETPADANWGFEASRIPQMWNLNNAVAKLNRLTPTAVIDDGFFAHRDLAIAQNLTPGVVAPHGTHVAGIIAARPNLDGVGEGAYGIDGVTRFAQLIVMATTSGQNQAFGETASDLLFAVDSLIRTRPGLRVLNVSLAFNWYLAGVRPAESDVTAEAARIVANEAGALVKLTLQRLANAGHTLPVVVAAAGNGGLLAPLEARYGSPMGNAALAQGVAPIIVVEALHLSGSEVLWSLLSNTGGHLSAPGVNVTSLSGSTDGYEARSGTSQAAPHVTGVVSYLYTLRPDIASPTMTTNPMRDLLVASAIPMSDGKPPRLDAFAAVLAAGGDAAVRLLLDVDDGTLHGNQRTAFGQDYTVDRQTDPAQQLDGQVTMRDFRRWRDWLLQADDVAGLTHDGSASHPKKDIDGDGRADANGLGNFYPRGDFNGDGFMSRNDPAPVPAAIGAAPMTDLQVLMSRFADNVYEAQQLPGLIESADLLIDPTGCLAVPGAVSARSTLRPTDFDADPDDFDEIIEAREHQRDNPDRIYTAPTRADGYDARVFVRDAAGKVIASNEAHWNFRLGSFARWFPTCYTLDVEVQFEPVIPSGTATRIVLRAELRDPVSNATIPVRFAQVRLSTNVGFIQTPNGTTDANGNYTTFVTPPAGGTGEIRITVRVTELNQLVEKPVTAFYAPPGQS